MARLGSLLHDESVNALLSWALLALLAVIALRNAVIGRFLWAGFALAIIAVALVPAVVTRNWSVMVTWEAFFLAAIPILAQLGGVFVEPLTYLSVATLALLIAVHLVSFSEVRMPPWFAVVFVIMTTMTVAAGWAVVQYYTDAILGTSYIPSRAELMWDFVGSIAGGLLAGLLFEFYFTRHTTDYRASTEGDIQ